MAWFFYDSNGNVLQVTGAHTLATHTGTLAVTAGGTGATSATAAATALGVGTGDSPQLTGVNVGHASDTTVTRASAGDIAVEGSLIYRAGGTDVPLTDGGTGASSASAAATALGLGTASNPQFATVELGAASDTTLARASAGNITVEGNAIYRAGGGDVPVADGGTGASTLTQNGALIGNAANAITAVDMSTKGGLLAGDGSGNPSVLAVGANGLALVADSGEATGLKYASAGVGLGLVIALGG